MKLRVWEPSPQITSASPEGPAPDEVVRAAIDRLRPEHREGVLMRYFEDSSLAEVAALLVISVRAVEGRLYKARVELRRMLRPPVITEGETRDTEVGS